MRVLIFDGSPGGVACSSPLVSRGLPLSKTTCCLVFVSFLFESKY